MTLGMASVNSALFCSHKTTHMAVQAQCALTEYDYLFKILLKGDNGVGKSSFSTRYIDGTFSDNFVSSLGLDFRLRTIESPDFGRVKIQLWDPAGQERYRAIANAYYRGAHGILVLFDCTDRDWSFKHVTHYFDEIDNFASPNVQKILVATKTDRADRQVTYHEAKNLADRLGVPYIETSSKDDYNVNEAMDMIIHNIGQNFKQDLYSAKPFTSTLPPPDRAGLKFPRCSIM